MSTILAWHWSHGLKCRYDNRPIIPGETLVYDGKTPIALCARGLHASTRILDALEYAPGTTISRVRLSGEIIRGDDKIVATHRETIWSFDATYILITFAADCAERALLRERKAGIKPQPVCFEMINAAREFVKDPSEENSRAAWCVSRAATVCRYGSRAAYHAARAASYKGADPSDAAWAAGYAACAFILDAHSDDEELERVELEQKWQSARLQNLIAEARREQR